MQRENEIKEARLYTQEKEETTGCFFLITDEEEKQSMYIGTSTVRKKHDTSYPCV